MVTAPWVSNFNAATTYDQKEVSMKTQIKNRAKNWPGRIVRLLCLVCLAVASLPALAQGDGTYRVEHKFQFMPQGDVVQGQWNYYVFTNASAPPDPCGPLKGSKPMPVTDHKDCASAAANAKSKAQSKIQTNNFAPGNVSGTIGVNGEAKVTGNPGSAFSAARSGVAVRGGKKMRNGRIKWGPLQRAQVQGQASSSVHDPISFDVFDPNTSTHTTGTLLSIDAFLSGHGAFDWEGNTFSLNAKYFDFTIQMNSPFTTEQGTLDFQVRNGIVMDSLGTGMFAGLLPGVGSSGNFSVPFSNDITLDYNLGNMGGNNPDVTFSFDGGGQAVAGIPEPSSLLLLGSGLLGLGGFLRKRLLTRS